MLVGWARKIASRQNGQSTVETALLMPFLLTLVLNAVNLGYFFFVVLNLTAAPRTAVFYSIQGGQTPAQLTLPSADLVRQLAVDDISGSIPRAGRTAVIRVCTKGLGVDSGSQLVNCQTFGSGCPLPAQDPTLDRDPEAPVFALHRVDIVYQVTPLVKGTFFNLVVPSTTCFRRHARMRSMD